jgi:hypothetical protein
MIRQFLIWDFRTYRMHWALMTAVACAILGTLGFNIDSFFYLFMICFLFSAVPTSALSGSKVRTQHVLSRNYLLSLPYSRKSIYTAILIRSTVFYVR